MDNLEQALGNWLDHKAAREKLLARYAAMHAELRCDSGERVAQALAPYLERGARPFPTGKGLRPHFAEGAR